MDASGAGAPGSSDDSSFQKFLDNATAVRERPAIIQTCHLLVVIDIADCSCHRSRHLLRAQSVASGGKVMFGGPQYDSGGPEVASARVQNILDDLLR